ncbi:hypothetical protein [Bacteroides pyogenes]|uniref:hypothetical protein n=1 Tax=Bacteroides pyogenes TaxID=310300 RepID=UPI0011C07BFC|nr:hypothetical protein [Bacteroides pyogenes]MBB3896257.1 hypothetical protein [Bacteroides pyogenes]
MTLLAFVAAWVRDRPLLAVFDDGTNGISTSVFLVIWSLIWYGIGYSSRKKYKIEKKYYREKASNLNDEQFNRFFKDYYISKNAKMLFIVFLTAIPWYILGYVSGHLTTKDWCVIAILIFLTLLAFGLYKIKQVR